MISQMFSFLWKEFLVEWRNKSVLGAILLYAFSTVYIIYSFQNFKKLSAEELYSSWNILFWLVILFITVNAISKSFNHEGSGRYLYYYTIANPTAFILAKILYGILSVLLLSLITLFLFILFFGFPFQQFYIFLLAMFFGGGGLAIIFVLISAIASKVENNFVLVSIMGFPLILPFMAFTMQLSELSFAWFDTGLTKNVIILALFDVLLVVLSVILFPFIWRN
ncbi:MAG: ABC transporter permease [Chitinophagales bacterium]|nr:ABC transporter permease [Chitinophagales bacterium]